MMLKKKSLIEKFQEDYIAVITPCDNKDGFRVEYVYYSIWYIWNLTQEEIKKRKRTIFIECIASIVVVLLTAIIKPELSSLSLVAFPALFSLCALAIEIFGVGQFCFAKYKTTRFTFEDVNRRLRVYPVLNLIFSTLASAGCAYYMLSYGLTFGGVAVMLCYVTEAVLSYIIFKQYINIPFTTEKNDILDHVERATLS